ncbi:MAG: hypothetical protein JW920_09470, partial [Deltaproteobacteria bacterium]|nr:hypothetical protein [Deltaproteobacteria bacterium]
EQARTWVIVLAQDMGNSFKPCASHLLEYVCGHTLPLAKENILSNTDGNLIGHLREQRSRI